MKLTYITRYSLICVLLITTFLGYGIMNPKDSSADPNFKNIGWISATALFWGTLSDVEWDHFDMLVWTAWEIDDPESGTIAPMYGFDEATQLGTFVSACHTHSTLAIASLWGNTDLDDAISENMSRLAENLVDKVDTYSLDGLCINWEMTGVFAPDPETYADFLGDLRTKLDSTFQSHKILTATGLWPGETATIDNAAEDDLDFLSLQAYDYDGSHLPSYGTIATIDETLQKYLDEGWDADMIYLGIPFHARYEADGGWISTDNLSEYKTVYDKHHPSPDQNRIWDPDLGAYIEWNGPNLVAEKVTWAKEEGLGGVWEFELGSDKLTSGYSIYSLEDAVWSVIDDTIAPAPVTNLTATEASQNSVTLTWTAPGDNNNIGTATTYDIRYSTSTINEGNWSSASQATGEPSPQSAGTPETFTVTGLTAGTTYYFALKTRDEVPLESDISNIASKDTASPEDETPPDSITDLEVINPTENTLTLRWTAPGDDGNQGIAHSYLIRRDTSPITAYNWSSATAISGTIPDPASPGTSQTCTVTGLDPNTTYYFAIKTRDEVPNWSGISNSPDGTTLTQGGTQIVKAVAASADDGWAYTYGLDNSSGWFAAGNYGGYVKTAYFRFTCVGLPDGAVITDAHLNTIHGQFDANTRLKIRAEKASTPAAPTSQSDLANRTRTSAGVDWDSGYADWGWHDSPDFTDIIQELVDENYGDINTILIIIDDDGSSANNQFGGSTYDAGAAPELHISYTVPEPVEIVAYVGTGADDGWADDYGYFGNSGQWYAVGKYGGFTKTAFFRFTSVGIPEDARITSAVLRTIHGQFDACTRLKIYAADASSPTAPVSQPDLNSRTRTSTGIDWDSGYADWGWHDSVDISDIIQELVDTYGSINTILLIIEDDGSCSCNQHGGSTYESGYIPELHITYN